MQDANYQLRNLFLPSEVRGRRELWESALVREAQGAIRMSPFYYLSTQLLPLICASVSEPTVQTDPPASSENNGEPGPSSLTRPVGAPPSPPTSPVRPIERSKGRERENSRAPSAQDNHKDSGDINDPLAEFYQQAKLQRQNGDGVFIAFIFSNSVFF